MLDTTGTRLGWIVAIVCLLSAGCGDGRVTVEGTVSFEGRPVEEGTISFVPVEPGAAPDAGPLRQGRVRFPVAPGSKRVEIRASRPLRNPPAGDPDAANLREDYIPARYNTASELTAEIEPSGNVLSFELESNPAGP